MSVELNSAAVDAVQAADPTWQYKARTALGAADALLASLAAAVDSINTAAAALVRGFENDLRMTHVKASSAATAAVARARAVRFCALGYHIRALKASATLTEAAEVSIAQLRRCMVWSRSVSASAPESEPEDAGGARSCGRTVTNSNATSSSAQTVVSGAALAAPLLLPSSPRHVPEVEVHSELGLAPTEWRVLSKPPGFLATGELVRTLHVAPGPKYSVAVSGDERWVVVGYKNGTVAVHSLPDGSHVRTFGGPGLHLLGLCFAPNGNIVGADYGERCLQELSVTGECVRVIGAGAFVETWEGAGGPAVRHGGYTFPRFPVGVAMHGDALAVSCCCGRESRVLMFSFITGELTATASFGCHPFPAYALQTSHCSRICFTPCGRHVIVAEPFMSHLSMFTASGKFVRRIGAGVLKQQSGPGGVVLSPHQLPSMDVCVAHSGREVVVIQSDCGRMVALSCEPPAVGGPVVRRQFTTRGSCIALAVAGPHVYAVNSDGTKLFVFE